MEPTVDKFPALNLYKYLMTVLAVLSAAVGVMSIMGSGDISSLVLSLGIAFGFLISSEIIKVFLHIEDHLEDIHSTQLQTNQILVQLARAMETTGKSNGVIRQNAPTLSTPKNDISQSQTANSAPTVRAIVVVAFSDMRNTPDLASNPINAIPKNTRIVLHARTPDNQWVAIDTFCKIWLQASDLRTERDILVLNVADTSKRESSN